MTKESKQKYIKEGVDKMKKNIIISNNKKEILRKLDRAKHLAVREELLKYAKEHKKIKELQEVLELADKELIEADYTDEDSVNEKKEIELLDKIELALDDEDLTLASELFEQFLDYSYNTHKKIDSKNLPKCTTIWAVKYYLSLSDGALTRSEELAERLVKLHELVFMGNRSNKKVIEIEDYKPLTEVFSYYVEVTGGKLEDFVEMIRNAVEDLDFYSDYVK